MHTLWSCGEGEPLVLFKDGACASLDNPSRLLVEPQWEQDTQLLWAGQAGQGSTACCVAVLKSQVQIGQIKNKLVSSSILASEKSLKPKQKKRFTFLDITYLLHIRFES